MDKNIETMLMECHILMSEALKGYEDRAYISNKLFEIRQYRNKLPEDIYGKNKEFADKNIRPMAYDVDFWSFIEKDESCGSYNEENHFIVDSDRSLENIIFRKYNHVHGICGSVSKKEGCVCRISPSKKGDAGFRYGKA